MFRYLDKKLDAIFANDEDPLNKVRAQFLVNGLIMSLFVTLVTLPQFFIVSPTSLLSVRSAIIAVVQFALIWILLNTTRWKLVAHFACIILAVLIWSNIFINIPGVKIISLQWMLLLIVMSYYLLGTKWGIFYSTISLAFMLFYFALFGASAMTAVNNYISNIIFTTVFVFNFVLIIYLQYHFFNAFNNTIKQLNLKEKEGKLLNEKLTDAVRASEESSKAKTYFLSTISHELRTPLNGVIGMSNVLLLDNPREDQRENLNMLKFSANNLLSLINDVLDINKIESGKIEIEHIPFKIFDLVKNIQGGFKTRAAEKNLELELKIHSDLEDLAILGDPTRLTQILGNLIENAIKFTTTGKVSLLIKSVKKIDHSVSLHFCVKDTGIGIPSDKHSVVFESFSQASTSTTRKYGGTGLGLAIVKNLLELHHSKIEIASEVGEGTSFSFVIDYKLYDFYIDEKQHYKTTNDMDLSNLKILVAEDNQMNILLMKKLLARWDINPDFATNGSEAYEAFKANDYDLNLMDIHMPLMDGYEATARIRSFPDQQKSNVQIIALTASVAVDVRTKIAEAGINDFISKPFIPEELREKLEDIATVKS